MIDASRTLVTGFTAFGRFAENPSAVLAAGCGRPFRLIEVAYAAADAFVASFDPSSFDRLLMLGVAGTSDSFRVERVARNVIGSTPDVRGLMPNVRVIDPDAPSTLTATLWTTTITLPEGVVFSDDAGDYLCNYLAFRALQRFGGKRVGFLHVPPIEAMDAERQIECLSALLYSIERASN